MAFSPKHFGAFVVSRVLAVDCIYVNCLCFYEWSNLEKSSFLTAVRQVGVEVTLADRDRKGHWDTCEQFIQKLNMKIKSFKYMVCVANVKFICHVFFFYNAPACMLTTDQ